MNDFSKQAVVARRALTPVEVVTECDHLPVTVREVNHEIKQGKRLDREVLADRIEKRLDVIHEYLTPERLAAKLDRANLSHIGIYEGILFDKLFLLRGHPTQIIGAQDHQKLDDLMPALLMEIQRRGLSARLTERTAEITTGGSAPSESN